MHEISLEVTQTRRFVNPQVDVSPNSDVGHVLIAMSAFPQRMPESHGGSLDDPGSASWKAPVTNPMLRQATSAVDCIQPLTLGCPGASTELSSLA